MSTPPFQPEDVLNCARSIRPFLPDLVGAETDSFDRQLADLLAQAKSGASVAANILQLLKGHPKTRQWMAEYLSPKEVPKGFDSLPGSHGLVSAQRYLCPEGDYIWVRRSLSQPIPPCPTHPNLDLIPE